MAEISHAEASTQSMSEMLRFSTRPLQNVSTIASALHVQPRLGSLLMKNKSPIETPHYFVASSRSVIPHVTQDNVVKHTNINLAHFAIEDCAYFPLITTDLVLTSLPAADRD